MGVSIREEITQQIIQAIEAGTPPWRKSWSSPELHQNAKTGQAYKGINQLLLSMTPTPYADHRWLTFKQAEAMGVKIKKGSKGHRIVKMVEVDRRRGSADDESEVLAQDECKALVMKGYVVFNAEQVDGLPERPKTPTSSVQPVVQVDAVIEGMKGTGLTVHYGGGQPAYSPLKDTVRVPTADRFHSPQDAISTMLHELAHASGHKSRLNRLNLYARFGSEEYSREELRAELASALLGAQLGVPMASSLMESHASYIASWLTVLKQDKNEIFRASADAQRIADYLGQWAMQVQPNVGHMGVDANVRQAEVAEKPASISSHGFRR